MTNYTEIVKKLRNYASFTAIPPLSDDLSKAADAIEELGKSRWIPVTEQLPECEWGAEIGNIEWISCGMVSAGCFGRGGKYRDAYFRTWTDDTEGIDAKDADAWRLIILPEFLTEKAKTKLEIAKKIIVEHYHEADCGLFDCRGYVADPMNTIYDDGELTIDICYSWAYFEVFGLSDNDFAELKKFYDTL